jgi:IMP dehydrogenase
MAILAKGLPDHEFWYDDLLIICDALPTVEREAVNLKSLASRNIELKTPFISSPMDTVTESKMAILMALMGGIGVIHYNLPIDLQAEEVLRVKRFEAAFVIKPIVLAPKDTVGDVYEVARTHGFFSVPITEDGTMNAKLVGIVTHRDIRYFETPKELTTPLAKVMTPSAKLITAPKEATVDKNDIKAANKIIREHNLDTLPIVDKAFKLVALVTDSDIRKNRVYPLATKDGNKQLKVLAAIESRMVLAQKRLPALVAAEVDGVVVDASVVFAEQLAIAKYIKKASPGLEVILGNVDSGKMVYEILSQAAKYVDGIRVGIGPGAACITQEQLGVGRAQGSAVYDCYLAAREWAKKKKYAVPLIADGGVKRPSDIVKALALGANTVMMGGLLAGLDESPGEPEFDDEAGRLVKKYRGMGSQEAMDKGGAVRYRVDDAKIRVVEGKSKKIGYKGSGYVYLPHMIAAIKQSIHKLGFSDIASLQKEARIVPSHL